MKKFPVLGDDTSVKYVDWGCLNNFWALRIHNQNLERLAERGGLSPEEIVLNIEKRKFGEIKNITTSYANNLVRKIQVK